MSTTLKLFKLFVLLVLATGLAKAQVGFAGGGQITTSPCSVQNGCLSTFSVTWDIAEPIPENAVEPLYNQGYYSCPRLDFNLDWIVVRKEDYVQSGAYFTVNTATGVQYLPAPSPRYRFMAICVKQFTTITSGTGVVSLGTDTFSITDGTITATKPKKK